MKKILFSDKFLLTKAVLDGRKTQTRRICKEQIWAHSDIVNAENGIFHFEIPKYKVGEVVAVAQSYETISNAISKTESKEKAAFYCKVMKVCFPDAIIHKDKEEIAGWYNKMFTRAELIPHQIRITDVRVERLQDISDEDCIKEGVRKVVNENGIYVQYYVGKGDNACSFENPREAFAHLINKVSRKDVWVQNPYVFVYDFELVK